MRHTLLLWPDGCARAEGSKTERYPEMKVERTACSQELLTADQPDQGLKAAQGNRSVGLGSGKHQTSGCLMHSPGWRWEFLGPSQSPLVSQAKCLTVSWVQVSSPAADFCRAIHSLLPVVFCLQQRRGLGASLAPKWSPSLFSNSVALFSPGWEKEQVGRNVTGCCLLSAGLASRAVWPHPSLPSESTPVHTSAQRPQPPKP